MGDFGLPSRTLPLGIEGKFKAGAYEIGMNGALLMVFNHLAHVEANRMALRK
ncbi:hypothetical protein [Sulfobacillus thermosulfidooxidans]|uniref:hypothetical protein n=1 Tax=Sulfobacillus thermosulfidooxidans TaxID=28034 RepID=UPI000B2AAF14|nr:hypothetical protein [Sulfobacillus thermosulfidooxidans]